MSPYSTYRRTYKANAAKRRRKKRIIRFFTLLVIFFLLIGSYRLLRETVLPKKMDVPVAITLSKSYEKPSIKANLLDPNPYSRPETPLKDVKGVVIHYVGNPGTSAVANRNYFNNLAKTKSTYASSHFVIDMDGTIIQCIPLNEMSYASNDRNQDTISIEVCHPDETGEFTKESYDALISLTKWLCSTYELNSDDVIRHYDVTGKLCPLYYVSNEAAWIALKNDIFKE